MTDGVYTKLLGLSIRREDELIMGNSASSGNSLSVAAAVGSVTGHPGSTSSSGSTIQQIRVTLTYPTASTANSSAARQLILRLTSDSDPIFFYHLRLGELDYPVLKQNQGLLVDFTGFPAQLMSLLDKCGDDKFQLVMRSGRDVTILDIVESNPFKYLAHLSLFVVPGSDCEVKRYLAQVTTDLKRENEGMRTQLQHMYASLQSELVKSKEEAERKDMELAQLKEQIRQETNAASEKYFREISSEKEKFIKFQSELTSKLEIEKTELERRHRENVRNLESKLTKLENDKRQLEQGAFRSNAKLTDYESRLKSNEEDLRILNQEVQMLRKNNNKLDVDYHEKQRAVANLTSKLTCCENEVKEKCQTIARQQDINNAFSEKVNLLEEKNRNLEKEGDRFKLQVQEFKGEVNKANEIIRKLQEESRQSGKKVKMQAQILSSQEKLVSEKSEELTKLKESHKLISAKTDSLEKELTETKAKLNSLEEKATELSESVQSKQDMIDWLNQQLNEKQGLASLSKFRQNLNESSRVAGGGGGGGDAPSWLNIYNSSAASASASGLGLGLAAAANSRINNNNNSTSAPHPSPPGALNNTNPNPNTSSNGAHGVVSVEETLGKLSVRQKPPSWAKSAKVTLGPSATNSNKPTLPLWKK